LCYNIQMESQGSKNPYTESIHWVLARSYSMYFLLFLIGVSLDLIFRLKIFSGSFMMPIGAVFLILGSILVLWAQRTSRNLHKEEIKKESFCRGPYCYSRSPTYWGLFLLMLGFGIIANAFFVVLSTVISFIIARFIFQHKEEKILEKKYGDPYLEYKKLVKF